MNSKKFLLTANLLPIGFISSDYPDLGEKASVLSDLSIGDPGSDLSESGFSIDESPMYCKYIPSIDLLKFLSYSYFYSFNPYSNLC
jgi:hypothetical protein